MPFDERTLNRVKRVPRSQILDRQKLPAVERDDRRETRIDRAVDDPIPFQLSDRHGAGTAAPLPATFFGTGSSGVTPKILERRHRRVHPGEDLDPAAKHESNRVSSIGQAGRCIAARDVNGTIDGARAVSVERILVVLKADEVGGAQRSMASLVRMLEDRDITCELVTLQPGESAPGLLRDWPRTELWFPSSLHLVNRFRQWRWLRSRMRRGDLDAVVAFGPIANLLVSLARARTGPRVILSERGDPFIARRRSWNRRFLWLYRRADVLLLPTRLLADEMQREWRRPPVIRTVPNSLAREIPIASRGVDRPQTIAAVGRLVRAKGFADLIEAFSRLQDRARGWEVVLIGDGPDRPRLETLACDRGVADRVRFVGLHAKPWEILARADLFVSASHHEGFSNVLLEAMASGCAIVSSDCRFGPLELVVDGENGILYPVGDIARLATILAELIADPKRRDALAEGGLRRARDLLPEAVLPRWLEVLGEPLRADETRR